MANQLSAAQRRYLKKMVHSRHVIVIVGNAGLTEAVIKEADSSLQHHELMKIRINAEDRAARTRMSEELCDALNANLVLAVGHVIAVYRPAKPPIIKLPKP